MSTNTGLNGTVAEQSAAFAIYRLADSLGQFRYYAELNYADASEADEFGSEHPPIPFIVNTTFWAVLAATTELENEWSTPEATAVAREVRAVHQVFSEAWLNKEHAKQIRERRESSETSDHPNPAELDWQVLRRSPLRSAAWNELNKAVDQLAERLPRSVHCIFELSRALAEVIFPLRSSFNTEHGQIPMFDTDYLINNVSPHIARLVRNVQSQGQYLKGVQGSLNWETPHGSAAKLREQVLSDLSIARDVAFPRISHASLPQDPATQQARSTTPESVCISDSYPSGIRTTPLPTTLQPHLSAEERNRLSSIRRDLDPEGRIIGISDAVLVMFREIHECCLAGHRVVLILGPTGTGKSTIAEFLHTGRERINNTPAPPRPMNSQRNRQVHRIGLNPAHEEHALRKYCRWQAGRSQTANQLSPLSEWLGFAPRSGYADVPIEGQDGLLKQYETGTIFIDEFARLSGEMQVALLDFAEGQRVSPFGAEGVPFCPNVHLVFATNEDVSKFVREDLRFRIKATIRIPPLSSRIEDVFPLAIHFLGATNYTLDFRTWLLLLNYSWPGNIRELHNVIQTGITRMQVCQPGSFQSQNALSRSDNSRSRKLKMPKKTQIPFGLFADQEVLAPGSREITNLSQAEACQRVITSLEKTCRTQGYEEGKRGYGLSSRIASMLGITPVKMTRLRKKQDGGR